MGVCISINLGGPQDCRDHRAGEIAIKPQWRTAKGFCFITLEDETGHMNAIVRPQLFEKLRMTINLESSLLITGRLQNQDGVIHVMSEQIEPLPAVRMPTEASHDYH